jgi:hypothetical protein
VNFRRARKEDYMEGAEIVSLKDVFRLSGESDKWLNI